MDGRPDVLDAGLYARNSAAMWTALVALRGFPLERTDGLLLAETANGVRALVVSPTADTGPAVAAGAYLIEDPYGVLPPPAPDLEPSRLATMIRPAGPVAAVNRPGVAVTRVGEDRLADVEPLVVEGFPYPWAAGRPGALFPPGMTTDPAFRVWGATVDGVPAGGGFSFDDGVSVCVYMLAVLPGWRSRGAARALLTAMLAGCPDRPTGLVATSDGAPLYRSVGFQEVSTGLWWRRTTTFEAPSSNSEEPYHG
ncbi:MAG: GNAT family N-acetyltransferase [Mycobacteriales bacterium]